MNNSYYVPQLSVPARVHNARGNQQMLVWFEEEALLMQVKGEEPIRVRLKDVVEVRMNYAPAVNTRRVQRGPHRVCSLTMVDGRVHRIRAELDQPDAADEYRNLMLALHAELGRRAQQPAYFTGIRPWAYWSMMVGFGLVFGGMEVGMVLLAILGPKEKAGMAVLFFLGIGLIGGYFLWKTNQMLGSKSYDPQQLHKNYQIL